ncbi:MAG: hypothetical protein H7312_09215 [Tardiphaga sp.]|nr:hypothetical protein [Tardiphaga sp.]
MATFDQIVLSELVAIRGEFAEMIDKTWTITREARDLNQFLASFIRPMKSTN